MAEGALHGKQGGQFWFEFRGPGSGNDRPTSIYRSRLFAAVSGRVMDRAQLYPAVAALARNPLRVVGTRNSEPGTRTLFTYLKSAVNE
jgi:hypothetical protein